MDIPQVKVCTGCKNEKEVSEFYVASTTRRDGTIVYQSKCKSCIRDERGRSYEHKTEKRFPSLGKNRHMRESSPDGMSYCGSCQSYKKLSDFSANKRNKTNGIMWACKECMRLRQVPYKSTPEKYRRATYKMTTKIYNDMIRSQNGLCAICGEHPGLRDSGEIDLHIDHDHDTGAVRGLLCRSCNLGLGFFRDDKKNMMSAIDYLSKYER